MIGRQFLSFNSLTCKTEITNYLPSPSHAAAMSIIKGDCFVKLEVLRFKRDEVRTVVVIIFNGNRKLRWHSKLFLLGEHSKTHGS